VGVKKDCGYRSGRNRKPKPDCRCLKCKDLRERRRERRKVANMTPAQREAKNAAQRAANVSPARRRRRNTAQRVEGMTSTQLRRERKARAERSYLYRLRRASFIPKDPQRVAAQLPGESVCPRCGARQGEPCVTSRGFPVRNMHAGRSP
jgi:hypothetical protein